MMARGRVSTPSGDIIMREITCSWTDLPWVWDPTTRDKFCRFSDGTIMRVDHYTHEWSTEAEMPDGRQCSPPSIDND